MEFTKTLILYTRKLVIYGCVQTMYIEINFDLYLSKTDIENLSFEFLKKKLRNGV